MTLTPIRSTMSILIRSTTLIRIHLVMWTPTHLTTLILTRLAMSTRTHSAT
ncbi:hypothetical protein [Listeria innocua]|uniref:hypothetical protein n=1 Tax=Listeria innocua TaxID=1642 RepID=UPI001AE76359|nr:hypothetical protein [Listeria innocua]